MDHVFPSAGYDALGKRLVRIAQLAPKYLVTQTPFMTVVVKVLFFLFGARRRVEQLMRTNAYVGRLLGFKRTQFEAPGITWGHRGNHAFPLVMATYEQQLQYFEERSPVQVAPQLVAQIDHVFQRQKLPSPTLPKGKTLQWLRLAIENSPAHWYMTVQPDALHFDFSTVVDEVAHESADCKYNLRDVALRDDGTFTVNGETTSAAVVKLSGREDDADPKPVLHHAFFALTLLQQANEVSYHNWVHFYFNDLVALNLDNHFPDQHWLRTVFAPHMRYQNVLNNAGMFAPTPSQFMPHEAYDDILYGAMLSSWSSETFRNNVIDKCLGYYVKAEHARACRETRPLDFNLNALVRRPRGAMEHLVQQLEGHIASFLDDLIARCATEADVRRMALVNENVLRFVHPDCLAGLPEAQNTPRGIFRRIVTRFLLQAGVLHGLEHFSMFFWFSPLRLPQRIRALYDPALTLADYAYPVDHQNGYFGNQMFTRYWPNADNRWNWSTLDYGFEDPALQARGQAFIGAVRQAIADYDATCLAPARQLLRDAGIEVGQELTLTPRCVGTSICI